MLNPGNVLGVA